MGWRDLQVAVSDSVTEFAYYWVFAALIAWRATAPGASQVLDSTVTVVAVTLWVLAELGNFASHYILANLRKTKDSNSAVVIPRGLLFELVSFPHYMCEILGWLAFNIASPTLPGAAYCVMGAVIMGSWAASKHANYQQRFDGTNGKPLYPPQRRMIVPWIL